MKPWRRVHSSSMHNYIVKFGLRSLIQCILRFLIHEYVKSARLHYGSMKFNIAFSFVPTMMVRYSVEYCNTNKQSAQLYFQRNSTSTLGIIQRPLNSSFVTCSVS